MGLSSVVQLMHAPIHLFELCPRLLVFRVIHVMARKKKGKGTWAQTNNISETVPEVSAEIKSEIMSFFPVGN